MRMFVVIGPIIRICKHETAKSTRDDAAKLPARLNDLCVRDALRSSSDGGDRSCFFFRELVSCLGERGIVSESGDILQTDQRWKRKEKFVQEKSDSDQVTYA